MKCARCAIELGGFKMSMFNQDMCCELCTMIEIRHPRYIEARDKEHNEVQKGNLNYDGIGLPQNYLDWAKLELKYDPELWAVRDSLTPEE